MNSKNGETIWISHSAISDFESCPRLYYLRNLYRNPETGHKIQVVNPYLTLGTIIHRTIEEINILPPKKRLDVPLTERLERNWQPYAGKEGGFSCQNEEENFKKRALVMLKRVESSKVIRNKSYKMEDKLPKVRLFKEQNLILVGSLDWIEILHSGGFHIIDFKTGRYQENGNSLQLPIYLILASYNFKKPIQKLSYWYLDRDREPVSFKLKPLESYLPIIQEKALRIKKTIDNNRLICKIFGGCFHCSKYEKVLQGRAKCVGYDSQMNRDLYFLDNNA